LRFNYIRIIWWVIFKAIFFWERVLVWSISPGGNRLIPARILLFHGNMRIAEQYWSVWSILIEAIGYIWLIATHMMSWIHTLVFAKPFLACHDNKFIYSYYEFKLRNSINILLIKWYRIWLIIFLIYLNMFILKTWW